MKWRILSRVCVSKLFNSKTTINVLPVENVAAIIVIWAAGKTDLMLPLLVSLSHYLLIWGRSLAKFFCKKTNIKRKMLCSTKRNKYVNTNRKLLQCMTINRGRTKSSCVIIKRSCVIIKRCCVIIKLSCVRVRPKHSCTSSNWLHLKLNYNFVIMR